MKRSNIVVIASLCLSVTCLVAVLWTTLNKERIVYVDTIKLFNEYNLKKDLEREAERKLLALKGEIDSTTAALKTAVSQKRSKVEVEELQYRFLSKKREVEDEYRKSNGEINEVVWKRLNPLIDQFGKEQGVELMVGANGMGTVLYGDHDKDMTAILIEFVNKQYEKGQ